MSPKSWHYSIGASRGRRVRSEEHTSELQSQSNLVCRLLLEKKNTNLDDKKTARRFEEFLCVQSNAGWSRRVGPPHVPGIPQLRPCWPNFESSVDDAATVFQV